MDVDESGQSMSMPMYFNTNLPVTVAFQNWVIKDNGTLIGSCFGVAGIAIIYEVLKKLRQYFWNVYSRQSPYNEPPKSSKVSPSDVGSSAKKECEKPRYAYFWGMHALNSIIFLVQVFIGYLLMLIVMVYNVWLVVSVVLGLCLGYFCAYFIGSAIGYDEMQTGQESVKSSMETIDMVVANKGADQPDLQPVDYDSDYGF